MTDKWPLAGSCQERGRATRFAWPHARDLVPGRWRGRVRGPLPPAAAFPSWPKNVAKTNPGIFSFKKLTDGIVDIRDFQTTGVVAFAKGCPFYALDTGRIDIGGHRVRVNEPYRKDCVAAVADLVNML